MRVEFWKSVALTILYVLNKHLQRFSSDMKRNYYPTKDLFSLNIIIQLKYRVWPDATFC